MLYVWSSQITGVKSMSGTREGCVCVHDSVVEDRVVARPSVCMTPGCCCCGGGGGSRHIAAGMELPGAGGVPWPDDNNDDDALETMLSVDAVLARR